VIRAVDVYQLQPLDQGWELAEAPPGAAETPDALAAAGLAWRPAVVPGTVASALARAGALDLERPPDLDGRDWWYRTRFTAPRPEGRARLRLPGLATVAEVWLNGTRVLVSDSMFHAHTVDVTDWLRGDNELHLRFRALAPLVGARRGRPRWRTRLVPSQQLRFFRTSLLGRMPGWCPRVPAVGPYRGVALELHPPGAPVVETLRLEVGVEDGAGVVRYAARTGGAPVDGAVLEVGERRVPLAIEADGDERRITGGLRLPDVALWWPHTHGPQPLYPARLRLDTPAGPITAELPRLGFRTLELRGGGNDGADGFTFVVNGVPIFCRGAVWTTPDVVAAGADEATYRRWLGRAREAGMNMLRIGGTMAYEADVFHDLCDELGILVWQELMFANMDYPAEDPAFAASVDREAEELARSLAGRPSTALFCGGSEVEQQAAMLGLPRGAWTGPLFQTRLPEALRRGRPDVAYWPASPGGGPLPFHANCGLAHYYGVGAYERPLDDARRADVRFASECLAFSNVPAPETIDLFLPEGECAPTHPAWKARVPRDRGVGWDFEDTRDHYVGRLFGVDPASVRHADPDRYLTLGRVATGEVMARTFGEWRRRRSTCRGALVWTFQDVWAGAGWGVVDALGRPKAAWHYLRRALAPLTVFLTDEGQNGLAVHLVNDTAAEVAGELRVTLYRHRRIPVAQVERPVSIPAREAIELSVDALLPSFMDTSYAYRFGPPAFDVAAAVFAPAGTNPAPPACRVFHVLPPLPAGIDPELTLKATARRDGDGWALTVEANRVAAAVWLECEGHEADDDFFTVEPDRPYVVRLRDRVQDGAGALPKGQVRALNAAGACRIIVARETSGGEGP
jgi:beta-mannosidase